MLLQCTHTCTHAHTHTHTHTLNKGSGKLFMYLEFVFSDGKHDFNHVLHTRADLLAVQHRAQRLKHSQNPTRSDLSQLGTYLLNGERNETVVIAELSLEICSFLHDP